MKLAPPMPAQLVATLLGLADHADADGRAAYPSVPTLAAYTCKSERSVQRDLKALAELGLIRAGDPAVVAHLPSDRRPEVYDLAVERVVPGGRAGDDEEAVAAMAALAASRARGREAREAKRAERGDVHVTSDGVTPTSPGDVHVTPGVTPTSERGDVDVASGVTPTSPKPSYEPPVEPSVEPPSSLDARRARRNAAKGTAKAAPQEAREDVEQICKHLADRVEANGSKRPPITDKWRTAARLLIDKDGKTVDQVMRCIDWCQDDSFWRANVMSMPKLREKYDQLRLKAMEQRGRQHRPYHNPNDVDAYSGGFFPQAAGGETTPDYTEGFFDR